MITRALCILLTICLGLSPAHARKAPPGRWQVSRTTDPITGASTCIVAAWDQAGGTSFSRVGAVYPFVENNPRLGLLVGVSSGGRYRIPTGDIVWRVDDRPFRSLLAKDNPTTAPSPAPSAQDPASKAMADMMALTSGIIATSTVASGPLAREMLAEMLAGQGLLFRSASAAPAYGLPSGASAQIGQITKDGLKPYPLDESLREGLAACGISTSGTN